MWRTKPLALQDCVTPDQRAKTDEYGDHLFIVMHSLVRSGANGREVLEAEEVDAFLGERYLVTVHRKSIKQVEAGSGRSPTSILQVKALTSCFT